MWDISKTPDLNSTSVSPLIIFLSIYFQYLKGRLKTGHTHFKLATDFYLICYINGGHYRDFTFPADHLLRLRFACDRHHLHQQSVSSLPDQRHHLLMSQLNYIHAIYLRQGRSTRRGQIRHLETLSAGQFIGRYLVLCNCPL